MGWSFRKSLKVGPFVRLNVSTRGVGVSAGVRGARVAVGPRGTYVTFGRGGFQYRQKLGGRSTRPRALPHPSPPSSYPQNRAPIQVAPENLNPNALITTATAQELSECSPDDALLEAQKALAKFSWFRAYAWLTSLLFVLLLCSGNPVILGVYAALTCGFGVMLYRWDRHRRTARLFYDVDNPEIVERLMMANGVGQWLSHAQCVWHIYYAEATSDWKRNAGASTLIRRTPTLSRVGSLERVELNIETWAVPVGPQRLLFLPDRLVVQEGKHLAGVPYDRLVVRVERTRFIEDGPVPGDARLLDTTWQHVNRDGGPDRRFAQNRQLPVLEYGELVLRSASGMCVVLQFSSPAAPEGAANVLAQLAQRASARALAQAPMAAAQAPVASQDQAARSDPEQLQAVAVLLRYLAAADRRISDSEISFASRVLHQLCGNQAQHAERLIASFRNLPCDRSTVARAIEILRASNTQRDGVAEALAGLANADGKLSPKERERLDELTRALA